MYYLLGFKIEVGRTGQSTPRNTEVGSPMHICTNWKHYLFVHTCMSRNKHITLICDPCLILPSNKATFRSDGHI